MMKRYIRQSTVFVIGLIIGYAICRIVVPGPKEIVEETPYQPDDKSYHLAAMGDTVAYTSIVGSYRKKSPGHPNYLKLSLEMANRFHYVPANYDVYVALRDVHERNGLKDMDERTRSLAMSYLQRATRLGCSRATKELRER